MQNMTKVVAQSIATSTNVRSFRQLTLTAKLPGYLKTQLNKYQYTVFNNINRTLNKGLSWITFKSLYNRYYNITPQHSKKKCLDKGDKLVEFRKLAYAKLFPCMVYQQLRQNELNCIYMYFQGVASFNLFIFNAWDNKMVRVSLHSVNITAN